MGKCVKGTIDKCIEYDFNQYSTYETCKTCQDGYYTVGDSCKIGKVKNCLKFNSELNCKECIKNYEIIDLYDDKNVCVKISEDFKCKKFSFMAL